MNKSKVILGTAQFGLEYGINNISGKPNIDEVFRIIKYAASHGINLLDTADAYGDASEALGKFNTIYPDKFLINTKFKSSNLSISEQLNISLKKLQTNRINVYFFHNFNDFIGLPSVLKEVLALKEDGKISKVGLSVYDNNEFRKAIDSDFIDVIQFPFNLLDNRLQRGELMELAKTRGKELQARSVFLQGLFFKSHDNIPSALTPLKPYLKQIKLLSEQHYLEIGKLSLLYALQQPEIDHIIIGIDNMLQLKYNLEIAGTKLDEEIIDNINRIEVKEVDLLYPKNWN